MVDQALEDEDVLEQAPFQHVAIIPPRRDHVGEQVMAEKWAALMFMEDERNFECNALLNGITSSMRQALTQRHANVAASFIQWIGTSCGRGFVCEAVRLMKEGVFNPYSAFVAAWAVENHRSPGVNAGNRAIESILVTREVLEQAYSGHTFTGRMAMPECDAQDFEVVEHVVYWLASQDGQRFLAECFYEIRLRQIRESIEKAKAFAEEHQAGNANVKHHLADLERHINRGVVPLRDFA